VKVRRAKARAKLAARGSDGGQAGKRI